MWLNLLIQFSTHTNIPFGYNNNNNTWLYIKPIAPTYRYTLFAGCLYTKDETMIIIVVHPGYVYMINHRLSLSPWKYQG